MSAELHPAAAGKPWEECQENVPEQDGKGTYIEDAVFGEATEDGPNYRSVRV